MKIVRDARLVTLNDLIVACRTAAGYYETAAELVSDKALARALSDAAKDRDATLDVLAEAVIAEDDIPNAPSEEAELVATALAHLKTVFTPDGTSQLLEDCKAKDAQVAETAAVMLDHEMDEELRSRVVALRDDAASRADRLAREHPPS